MAEDPRSPSPPVAIRITRPYTTEDEFLEQELDTLSRTSVTLLGAQPRPQGVVLRFELVLSSGHVLMRGEGRVVGFRPNVHQGMGGLTLRFTRLDTRSKGLVDKAATFRERRRPSARPETEPSPAPPPAAADVRPLAPPPEPPGSHEALPVPSPPPPRPLDLEATLAEAPRSKHPPPIPTQAAPPPTPDGREALLERLRSRGKALEPTAVARILERRRREA
ncbi:MAG: hypothetical protein ABSE49_24700 [Polyangiaceae bacterium]